MMRRGGDTDMLHLVLFFISGAISAIFETTNH